MANISRPSIESGSPGAGPYLAKIVSHLDTTYMGILEVQLMHEVGNDPGREGQLHQVKYLSPFYGVTGVDHISKDPDDYNNTQKSYGMWMIPPDVGTTVMVIFVEGDPKKGYWIGCVQDDKMNFMVPGYASTKYAVEDSKKTDKERVPVAEYNKLIKDTVQDVTQYTKPATPQEETLDTQGLLEDDARGITTSSARREVPSAVFGISTPGPVDKQGGAKQGKVGKFEHKVDGAFVSRLGGSAFVMDDGDDKFIRKTKPTDGPAEYAAVEQGETDGEVTIPHNELIRIRTRTGHQILLHNSEDLIYIGNARGTSWIELSSDGKIDIYAEDSVSLHTKQDMNFYADRDINFEAGRNLNIKVAKEMHTHVLMDHILMVDANQKIHIKAKKDETVDSNSTYKVGGNYDTNAGGHIWETSGGTNETKAGGNIIETAPNIHMNGPGAATASTAEKPKVLKTHSLPDEEGSELTQSIMRRIPTHEPYAHHENLDPLKYKPEKTDRDIDGRNDGNSTSIQDPAKQWKEYSTKTDTFEKIGQAEE